MEKDIEYKEEEMRGVIRSSIQFAIMLFATRPRSRSIPRPHSSRPSVAIPHLHPALILPSSLGIKKTCRIELILIAYIGSLHNELIHARIHSLFYN